ncbi:hypothetical protein HanXRQr2_Chr04g0150251 [Helianthus annuus]|uniref:Uncharacterized protein n=1 Tax=Helianthus annuus TaxID=4232 RepID=A0A9K3J5R7_HELAN|nr:hypothetical protein HanXRQr2_Chr04g0150251 [Helianthus annuus]
MVILVYGRFSLCLTELQGSELWERVDRIIWRMTLHLLLCLFIINRDLVVVY